MQEKGVIFTNSLFIRFLKPRNKALNENSIVLFSNVKNLAVMITIHFHTRTLTPFFNIRIRTTRRTVFGFVLLMSNSSNDEYDCVPNKNIIPTFVPFCHQYSQIFTANIHLENDINDTSVASLVYSSFLSTNSIFISFLSLFSLITFFPVTFFRVMF